MRTNTKIVSQKIQEHIMDQVESLELLRDNALAVLGMKETPDMYHAFTYNVDGGNFLIYHADVRDFLNSLGINEQNKKYEDCTSWELYKHLIASNAVKMIKNLA